MGGNGSWRASVVAAGLRQACLAAAVGGCGDPGAEAPFAAGSTDSPIAGTSGSDCDDA
ncbi:MAG: hypothetical protein AAF721_25130 [Myxococcota bacterium]